MHQFEVFFDCETKTFFDADNRFDPSKLGASIVSLYIREIDENFKEVKGEMISFLEKDIKKSLEYFQKANRVIGFNSISFDVPVLTPYLGEGFVKLPHFDILTHVRENHGKRVSLNSLARGTLGSEKNDSGENAILYFQKGDEESLSKLKKYCEMDVEITKNIYDFGFKNNYLKFIDFWNEERKVEVDFSYPKVEEKLQASLF